MKGSAAGEPAVPVIGRCAAIHVPGDPNPPMYTTFQLHDGVRICHLDFTNVQDETEALFRVNEAKEVIAKEPPESVYTITDVTGSRATPKIRAALHQLTQHNKPFVISGAVVGLTPIQRGMLRGIILVTGRRLVAAESMEAAIAALKREAAQKGVSV